MAGRGRQGPSAVLMFWTWARAFLPYSSDREMIAAAKDIDLKVVAEEFEPQTACWRPPAVKKSTRHCGGETSAAALFHRRVAHPVPTR